jgi:hypothetical protein
MPAYGFKNPFHIGQYPNFYQFNMVTRQNIIQIVAEGGE